MKKDENLMIETAPLLKEEDLEEHRIAANDFIRKNRFDGAPFEQVALAVVELPDDVKDTGSILEMSNRESLEELLGWLTGNINRFCINGDNFGFVGIEGELGIVISVRHSNGAKSISVWTNKFSYGNCYKGNVDDEDEDSTI